MHRQPNSSLYQILELKPDASLNDIKAAYRRLAKIWHPDKNDAPEAAEKFKQINQAYEVLSNTSKKADYDNSQQESTRPS